MFRETWDDRITEMLKTVYSPKPPTTLFCGAGAGGALKSSSKIITLNLYNFNHVPSVVKPTHQGLKFFLGFRLPRQPIKIEKFLYNSNVYQRTTQGSFLWKFY